jgi:hypothetical protein
MEGAKNAIAATIVFVSLIAGMFAIPAATQTGQVNDRDDVLRHLNAVIRWYKDCTTKIKAGQEPSDAIYVINAQNLGAQAVRLGFQSAREPGESGSIRNRRSKFAEVRANGKRGFAAHCGRAEPN